MVKPGQQGMALLMALVMMAIAVTLVAGIWYNSRLSLMRTHFLQQDMQAKHFSHGLLLWASDILEKDYAESEQAFDSHADSWQQGIQGIVVEQAVLSGDLQGLNHLFNVNNLVINNEVSTVHLGYFRRLLIALNMDVHIADKLIDWMDVDQEPRDGGAEDFAYAAENPPYQTASTALLHIRELQLIAGIDNQQFKQLLPYVTALPVSHQATKMNINTLAPVMIKALDNNMTEELALRIHQQGQASFTQMQDFYQFEDMRYMAEIQNNKELISELIDVQTRFMQARTYVTFAESRHHMYALLIRRDNGASNVLMRSSVPFLPINLLN